MTRISNHIDSRPIFPFRECLDSQLQTPRRISIAFSVILIALQIAIGTFIVLEYRALQIKANGEIGSTYVDILLAPYAMSPTMGGLGEEMDIETAFRQLAITKPDSVLRIWRPDGSLLLTTFGIQDAIMHDDDDLEVALTGQSVFKLEVDGTIEPGFPLAFPYMEIYAPIHDPVTHDLIAVGELYLDATGILRDRTLLETIVGLGMFIATACVLAMLAHCFRLSQQLQLRVTEARKMADTNDRLRVEAEQAHLDGANAHEQLLNLIGAELHDGPVQLLGIATLMDENEASTLPDGTSARNLIDTVLIELRTLAAGLILPELETLSADEVVALAIVRHHALFGQGFDTQIGPLDVDLDLPRKVCLYRVMQEGMANATRHGDEHAPRLTVVMSGQEIDIRIDGQAAPQKIRESSDATRKLGLQGMRRRLNAFGGQMTFTRDGRATVLRVSLPVGAVEKGVSSGSGP